MPETFPWRWRRTWSIYTNLFEQPYCRIGNVVEAGIVGRQAASRYLQALASIGVLEAQKSGRDVLFVHPKLLRLLTRDPNNFSRYR